MQGDKILVRGLQLICHIGVPEEERRRAQVLRAHLTMEVGVFAEGDEIGRTVNYKEVSDEVRELAARGERRLIESLAVEIADLVLGRYAVMRVRVELEKEILPEAEWVGVVIERGGGGE